MRTVLALILSALYGLLAALVFCLSGAFGRFGEMIWRDVMLVLVSMVATCALTYISLLLMTFLQDRRRAAGESGDPADLDWHLMIPCRDEESVIAATVSAARTSFPLAHVWVIDDASEDTTATIVRDLMVFDERVHLVSRIAPEARTGKGDALNAAYRIISDHIAADADTRHRTVIGVLDADGYLSDNALPLLAGPQSFADDSIGAAQVEVWMKNRGDRRPRGDEGPLRNRLGRVLVRMQDLEFRTTNSAMQLLRVRAGTVGMGGNGQFTRLEVLDELASRRGAPWGKKLSEDYELGLNILEMGYRNQYVRDAHVSQEALPYLRRLVRQRTRWAQGIMECAELLPALRRSGNLSVGGAVEIHYFMLQPLIMMLNLVLVPVLIVLAYLGSNGSFWTASTVTTVVLAGLIFLVMPYAVWGLIYRRVTDGEVSWVTGALLGLGNLVYVYLTYLYYARAVARMVTGRTAWAKTQRNADGMLTAPVILDPALAAAPLVQPQVVDQLAEELGSRRDLALEFVSGFAVMWPTRLARLEEAVAAEEPLPSRDAVGSIRVASSMVGADRLEQAASRLAEEIVAGDFDACRRDLPIARAVGRDTVEALRGEVISGQRTDQDISDQRTVEDILGPTDPVVEHVRRRRDRP